MVEQESGNSTVSREKTASPVSVYAVMGLAVVAFSSFFFRGHLMEDMPILLMILLMAAANALGTTIRPFLLCYLLLVYPLFLTQNNSMVSPALQRVYVLVLLGCAGFLYCRALFRPSMHDGPGQCKEERNENTKGVLTTASFICLGIIMGFFFLARCGNEVWSALRPMGHYLVLLLPVAYMLKDVVCRREKRTRDGGHESAWVWFAVLTVTFLVIVLQQSWRDGEEHSRDTAYSDLLREVVAKRDWLLSEEGRRTSYEQKTRTMAELDRRFSEFLHSHPDDGKMWLLRGILTRMRPDAGAKILDPLCFEEAARHLRPGDAWRIFYPYEERSFFEEAVGRLVELGYVKAADAIVVEAPKTEWGDTLRREVSLAAESGYLELDGERFKKPAEEPPWPMRQKIGRTAELIGFAPLDNPGGKDPREKIRLTGGDRLAFEAWIRFREEATLHPKKVRLSGVRGINLDLPPGPNLEVGGKPWEIARLPIEIALPEFLGPLTYEVSLVFEETWDFPPGPLACPLTVLDVSPRLTHEKVPLWKVEQFYGDLPFQDLGVRTIVAPGKGFRGSLPEPVSAKGLILVSGLSYASGVPPETKVAEIRVEEKGGIAMSLPIRVGIETAEILADNPRGKSSRGETAIWTSYEQKTGEGPETFEAHQYHVRIDFQKPMAVSSVGVEVTGDNALFLNVFHVLLVRADE